MDRRGFLKRLGVLAAAITVAGNADSLFDQELLEVVGNQKNTGVIVEQDSSVYWGWEPEYVED